MKRKDDRSCCTAENDSSCKVESIISVDERGQMVLPKDLRAKMEIEAGDKLVLTSWEKEGKVCCITLIKAEELVDMMKDKLGPVIMDVL
ncbi:MAG: HgcAB-associated protein [Deltaproteobacteria bacterium]|nr:HgcAB-associated protein [Deltaproteobacteria bacterium]